MKRSLFACCLLASLAFASPATAQQRDEEEGGWVGVSEIIESCLQGKRPLLTQGSTCIGIHSNRCLRHAENQTTVGMERCHLDEYRAWDALLNKYFRERPKGERGEAIQQVQRAWLTYRDRKCAYFSVHYAGGSMARWLGAQCMADTTARRAIELRFFREDAR